MLKTLIAAALALSASPALAETWHADALQKLVAYAQQAQLEAK